MKSRRQNRIGILIAGLLAAALLACAFSAFMYARYISTLETQYFDLSVKANYTVTFDAGEGSLRYPAEIGGRWLSVGTASAVKKVGVGETFGWNGTDNTDFPGDDASDSNAPARFGYSFEGWWDSSISEEYQQGEYLPGAETGRRVTKDTLVTTPSDITLYAHWRKLPVEYTVTYHENHMYEEYDRVEYVESNGTQYLDTGVKGSDPRLGAEIKYEWTALPTGTNYAAPFGSYQSENHTTTRIILSSAGVTYFNINRIAGSSDGLDLQREIGTVYTETLLPEGSNKFRYTTYYKGSTKSELAERSQTGTDCDNHISLFAQGQSSKASIKLYSFKLYLDGETVRDFVPVVRKSDNKAGLYDLISEKFYAPNGTLAAGSNKIPENVHTQHFMYGTPSNLDANPFQAEGRAFTKWSAVIDGVAREFEDCEEVINLTDEYMKNIDFYAGWKKQLNISVSGTDMMLKTYEGDDLSPADVEALKAKLETKYYTFSGLKDSSSNFYYYGDGSNAGRSPGDNILTLYAALILDSPRLPSGYTQLDYVSANGTNQVLSTDITLADANAGFEIQYEWITLPGSYGALFGSYIGEDNYCSRIIQYKGEKSYPALYSKAGGGSLSYEGVRKAGIIYCDSLFPDGSDSFKYTTNDKPEGVSSKRVSGKANSNPLVLFAQGTNSALANAKIYYLKVYNGDTLEHFLVPCKKENQVGYIDVAAGFDEIKFYTASGLTAGPVTVFPDGVPDTLSMLKLNLNYAGSMVQKVAER